MSYPYRSHPEFIESLLPAAGAGGGGTEYIAAATSAIAEVDDSYATLYAGLVSIEAATGASLDLLGDQYREARGGLGDFEYRRLLAGKAVARRGAVTYPRVWAGWLALTGASDGELETLPPASILLTAAVTWRPSSGWLARAGTVARALVGASYEVSALMYLADTAIFGQLPGFGAGTFAYQLRTGAPNA